jgi:predicted MPP superfamily phosphohydrolase
MAKKSDTKQKAPPTTFSSFLFIPIGIVVVMSIVILRVGEFAGLITASSYPWVIAGLAFLPSVLLCTMLYTRKRYNRVVSALYTASTLWFPMLMYLFLGAVLLSIISLGTIYLGYAINLSLWAWIIICIIVLKLIYGVINARWMRITPYTINSPELATKWAGKRIILFSDVHLGIVNGARFMEKIVGIVNNLKPDLVIIAGDIIDGPVFDYAKGLAPLKDLHAPDGLIYAQGNHEGYNSEPEKFYPIVEQLTTTLIDRTIIINGVQITGLAYAHESKEETRKRLDMAGHDSKIPSIVILHDPTNTRALQQDGVSLIVSGHTHKGQFFPFTLFMKSMYKEFAYGKNVKGSTTSITTSGVGTTMPPVRLGSNPEIVVLTFK